MTSQSHGAGAQRSPFVPQPVSYEPIPYEPITYEPVTHTRRPRYNVLALVALIISIVACAFASISETPIVGWMLLPIAFVLSAVSLFLKGTGKGLGIAGWVISLVGIVAAFVLFFVDGIFIAP